MLCIHEFKQRNFASHTPLYKFNVKEVGRDREIDREKRGEREGERERKSHSHFSIYVQIKEVSVGFTEKQILFTQCVQPRPSHLSSKPANQGTPLVGDGWLDDPHDRFS